MVRHRIHLRGFRPRLLPPRYCKVMIRRRAEVPVICTMHPAFGVAGSSHVFRAPNSEEIKRRSRVFSTNLTMANAYTDRSSLDLKSDFAAIAATRPLLHLEPLSPSFTLLFETKPASRGIGQPDRAPPTRSLTLASGALDLSRER